MLIHWRNIRAACRSLVAVALVMCGIATVSVAVLGARVVGGATTFNNIYYVNSATDNTTVTDCASSINTDCGIDNAIHAFNADTPNDADEIRFSSSIHVFNVTSPQAIISNAFSLTIEGNGQGATALSGGGIYSTLDINHTAASGAVDISGLTIEDGGPTSYSYGSGIFDEGAGGVTLTVTDSTITKNAGKLGGIFAGGATTLTDDTISGNTAELNGGGIYAGGAITLTDSTISGNSTTGAGGGIEAGGTTTLTDDTISENTAEGQGGGINNVGNLTVTDSTISGNSTTGYGGGIRNFGTATLTDDTISGNTASSAPDAGGGLLNATNDTLSVGASIVADNTGGDCYTHSNPSSVYNDEGYNIDDDGSCGFSAAKHSISDSTTLDLGPLANNGGPTETILPGKTSSAVGVIPPGTTVNGVKVCPRTDQRGVASSGDCSVGAVEVTGSANPTTSVLVPSNGAKLSGTTTLDASASNATSVEFWILGGSYGYTGKMIGTATPSPYGWIYSWNTTTVPNGSYALLSEAFNASASAFSGGISITVSNNSPPPTTSVLVPANGATLSGTTTLDASASNATSVEFWILGGSYGYTGKMIGTATPSPYGWIYSWNTTTVPNGSYALLSEAFNASASAFSGGISITVKN